MTKSVSELLWYISRTCGISKVDIILCIALIVKCRGFPFCFLLPRIDEDRQRAEDVHICGQYKTLARLSSAYGTFLI